jgi:hypothetical protein
MYSGNTVSDDKSPRIEGFPGPSDVVVRVDEVGGGGGDGGDEVDGGSRSGLTTFRSGTEFMRVSNLDEKEMSKLCYARQLTV